jgi:hypothetical protein
MISGDFFKMITERIVFLPGMNHGWVLDEDIFQNFITENEIANVSGVKTSDSLSVNSQLKEILFDMLKK